LKKANHPKLAILEEKKIKKIIEEAIQVLEKVGVFVENEKGLELLYGANCEVDRKEKKVYIKSDLVEKCLKTAPSQIKVFDREGELALDLQDDNIHFDPGSAALRIYDLDLNESRPPVAKDLINFARLTDSLLYLKAQSTALIPSDVPKEIADRYRLFIALQYSTKPIVTGTFAKDGFEVMKEMLITIRGNQENLKAKPLAIFDCCPSPPLKWSDLTCHDLICCAESGIPAELVSMPLCGATSPVTLAGALVQHTAENLSGIVIHQLANPGSPIIYGGSPSFFDMRKGTTPMGAIETMMIDSAYAQIGKYFNLPTHAYMGLSDAKILDYQSGLESAVGAILAALSGINVISGPGMLDFESCQSLEKLVLDNEICGMAYRLIQGIGFRDEVLALDLLKDVTSDERSLKTAATKRQFLTSPHTLKWFKKEAFFPSEVIDRSSLGDWEKTGKKTAGQRAKEKVKKILSTHQPKSLSPEIIGELTKIMQSQAKKYGLDKLSIQPSCPIP
jgi:trimethylamine--corrinoid protein Co-methyltransferase